MPANRTPFNRPKSGTIVASTNNIPTAFTTGAGSKVLTGLKEQGYSHIMVINGSTTIISVTTTDNGTTAPSGTTTERLYVLGSQTATFDDISVFDNIYVQSEGTAISTGTVYVQVW